MGEVIVKYYNNRIFADISLKKYLFGFGKEKGKVIELNPYECFYIIKKRKGILEFEKKKIKDILEIIKILKIDLVIYRVFEDLRDRGYFIKIYKNKYIIVYEKGTDIERYLCYPIHERHIIESKEINYLLELCKKLHIELLIAVVDIEGDVTYYKIKELRI